ncbi:uncharacterized protein LOC135215775 [Macrobrachium nipponense]|uniref:uncharacterized protein LOC135215775 n=1 Tax=Macrobrachium nipponense TaxID=159736 RepID=UPI0030C81003
MLFGLKSSPVTFVRLMDKILGDVLGKDVHRYIDDLVIVTDTTKEHIKLEREVLKRLRKVEEVWKMGSLNNQQGEANGAELAGWDPRMEDYMNSQSSTSSGSNFTRSNNLARNKEVVWEPRGLYVRNIPLSLSEESLLKIFSAHGKVLSVYIGKPRSDFAAADVTWGIVKVESMRDALAMITELNYKSPLKLKVELSLSEEERTKRKQEKEMERNAQKEMETCVSNRLCPEDLKQMMPVNKSHEFPASIDSGLGRGKMLASLTRQVSFVIQMVKFVLL